MSTMTIVTPQEAASILDGYRDSMQRFRAAFPEHAEYLDNPCDCEECKPDRDAASAAWVEWLKADRK